MIRRQLHTTSETPRRGWQVAIFLVVLSVSGAAQGPADDRGRADRRPLEPMAVSQIEQARADGPAAAIPQSLGVSQEAPPQPLRPLAMTQLDDRQRADDLEGGRVFSLSFAEEIPIKDLLLLLVRDTTLSIVPDPDIEGTFIGELKNVTFRQAIELILQPLALDYSVQGNFIRVFRNRLETRIFDVNYVITRRSGSRSLSASSAAGGASTGGGIGGGGAAGGASAGGGGGGGGSAGGSSANVSGTDSGDLFAELTGGIQTLLSPDGKFNLDRKAALLQVTDHPDRLDKIGLYLEAVTTRVLRQVLIQAKVIEVELNDSSAAGINWSTVLRSAGHAVNLTQTLAPATAGGFTLGVNINDFTGLINAFASQGKVNVLSSPRVVAMNNEPAIMRIGTQDVFFVTTSQVDATTGRVLQTTVTPQSITEGVVLSVTPQISADGMIHMSISPSITERTGQATSRLGDTVPIISVRESDTLVRVHENETIVIAGLMQDRMTHDVSKIPLLGDVPMIGGLFRRDEKSKKKTDLVILLTPTIMTPGGISEAAARDQDRLYGAQKAPEKK